MDDANFILAYEQNPQIYDYVFRDNNFYLNLEATRQYHFPWIDLSKNKLTLFTGDLKSNSIIYFSMHDFKNLLEILKKDLSKKYILLAEGGDGTIEELELSNNILHVYCPNLQIYNNRYSPYPRGILKNNFIKNSNYIKSKILYCNFTVYNYPSPRIEDFNYWKKRSDLEDWITVKPTNHNDNKTYWKDLYEHYFNICSSPSADYDINKNRDTYRFWETLASGGYPIIKRSKMAEFFLYELDLPLIIVDSWDEINLDKLKNLIPMLSKKNISPITEEYWINRLRKQLES
jgi:hypothetical protein